MILMMIKTRLPSLFFNGDELEYFFFSRNRRKALAEVFNLLRILLSASAASAASDTAGAKNYPKMDGLLRSPRRCGASGRQMCCLLRLPPKSLRRRSRKAPLATEGVRSASEISEASVAQSSRDAVVTVE